MAFWDNVLALRKIEFFTTLVMIVVPLLGGAVLLTLRHRIRFIQTETTETQGFSYQQTVEHLHSKTQTLDKELRHAKSQIGSLERITAPRQLSEAQQKQIVVQLRGVKASPVIVAAYAFEEESANYAGEIAGVLRKSGWDVSVKRASMNDFKGVSLGIVNLTQRPILGLRELAQAFEAAHVELHQRQISADSIAGQLDDGSILVVVGRK